MPIHLIRQDITKMKVDAIASPANPELRAGSGLNGLIHKVGGAELTEACKKLNGCKTGEAKITPAFALPCKYVIHTVGPVWHGGDDGEPKLLASCYMNALELATKHGCNTIAFPLISSGAYGYPKDKAMKVAINAISGYLFALGELDLLDIKYNDTLWNTVIDHVTVYADERLVFHFKIGYDITVEM